MPHGSAAAERWGFAYPPAGGRDAERSLGERGGNPLVTVTHARLRAAQGDRPGARRILRELLSRRPGDAGARRLLGALERGGTVSGVRPVADLTRMLTAIAVPSRREDEMLDGVLAKVQEAVDGLQAVFLLGSDGMIVAGGPGTDPATWEEIAAGYSEVLRRVGAANRDAQLDPPIELSMCCERAILVFRRVTDEYGLLAAIEPDSGSLGRTRYELRKAAGRLAPEIED